MDNRSRRSSVYAMFSTLLQAPNRPTYKELCDGRHAEIWNALTELPGYGEQAVPLPAAWSAQSFPEYEEWRALYAQAMPPVRPRLQAIESVHKVWSADPSCEMPFAGQRGLLQGDAAHHLFALYKELGFEVPVGFAECPDHLILELEFMGLLVEAADAGTQATFLSQHLDWIPALIEDAASKKTPEIYLELLGWLEGFLELERKLLGQALP